MELYVIIIQYHEDLKYFRNTMGRKTYESLHNGYLNNRMNIVITNKYLDYKNKKIFIIGGSEQTTLFLSNITG
jgi:dihydrofolate reductase